jgi:hypothetical protein
MPLQATARLCRYQRQLQISASIMQWAVSWSPALG